MEFQLVEADPMILVDQALETSGTYAEKYDVRFVFDGDFGEARVAVDPDRYIQVLNNVLSNAVRFSPKGGVVSVSAGTADGFVRVAVRDQGPGIDDEFRDQVFEKFARADDGAWRHRSGTGLGMSISKAIMDELGGSIWFETQKGAGTTFFVDLPEAH
jgi:signal transduction histidine kinase